MLAGTFPRKFSQINFSELLPAKETIESVKFVLAHNKNEAQYAPKDENLEAWKKEYIVPWGTLLDICIVLLYVFTALTFQTTKMSFALNFEAIFNSYFTNGVDGPSYLYFKNDIIDAINSSSHRFFTFEHEFPSQDPFKRYSNLVIDAIFDGGRELHEIISEDNLTMIEELAANISELPIILLTMKMTYIITRQDGDSELRLKVIYVETLKNINNLGIIEWNGRFRRAETERYGPILIKDQLSVDIFPYAIIIVDGIAIIFTLYRLISYLSHAKEYARKNYVSLYRAIVWKVNAWEIFNFIYQSVTMAAAIVYCTIIDKEFGDNIWFFVFIGFAGALHCVGLFRSLKMKEELWVVAQLITRSIGRSCQFVIGFLPFFFGFVFMGVSFFGYFCYLFIGFLRTMKILFSTWHTDVVMDTEDLLLSMAVAPPWLVYTFVILWMTLTGGVVINVLIALVEEVLNELIEEHDA